MPVVIVRPRIEVGCEIRTSPLSDLKRVGQELPISTPIRAGGRQKRSSQAWLVFSVIFEKFAAGPLLQSLRGALSIPWSSQEEYGVPAYFLSPLGGI